MIEVINAFLSATVRPPKPINSTIQFQRNSFSRKMSNFLKISSGVSLKISLWIVEIHCFQFLNIQKIQDNKHIIMSFQDCKYKDNMKVVRTTLLQVEIHPLKLKISKVEA
jgi:hypothetical protein